MIKNLLVFWLRFQDGACSRIRNVWFKALGVDISGRAWLRRISIPRQWNDIRIGTGAALDDGVTLICSGDPGPGKLIIGARCYVNRGTIFDASKSLIVGEDCMIGPHCYLTDHDHGVIPGRRPGGLPLIANPTRLGARVWLGAHVTILKGVTIGDDAVIAAGAVVTRDVPPGGRFAGVPARQLRASSANPS